MIKEPQKIIPGTFDPVFKEIFTSKDCHNFVCTLISLITDLDIDYLKENLKVVNPNLPKEKIKEKNKPTDVLLSVEGHIINIEMNNGSYYEGLFEKNDMYQHTILSRSMKRGESYKNLKKIIQINIDNFCKFKKEISEFKLMEIDTKEIENNHYIKYHIALPKIMKKYYNKNKLSYLEKLLCIIGIKTKEELEEISKGDKILMEASKKIEDLNYEELFADLYDVEKDRQMAEKAKEEYLIETSTAKGMKKGIKQGIEQGLKEGLKQGEIKGSNEKAIEIAKNLFDTGMDIETISKCTGINKEKIKKLFN